MNVSMSSMVGMALAAGVSLCALAQDLTVKAPPQNRLILIKNATLHTVSGGVIENGTLVLNDGKIANVFTPDQFRAWQSVVLLQPPGPIEIDATGRHVYPGLMTGYSQIGLSEIDMIGATRDISETGDVTPETRAIIAVNPDSAIIPVTRSNGVLLAATFPSSGAVSGQPAVIKLEGWTWEEMALSKSAGVVVQWPMMRPVTSRFVRTSESDQRKSIARQIEVIDGAFRGAMSYLALRAEQPQTPTDLRYEAMRSVLPGRDERGEPVAPSGRVFLMANDYDQIVAGVEWAVGLGLRPVVVGGLDAPLAAGLLKKHSVPVVITGTHRFPKRDDGDYNEAFALPAALHREGILFCLSNADDTAHERNLAYSAGIAVAHGLPPEAAIRALTLDAATIFGVADRVGSLEAGKDATLIITDGSPLEIPTRVLDAFIDGRRIDLSNKQTKLYEKYQERFRQTGDLKTGDPQPGAAHQPAEAPALEPAR